MTPKQTQNSAYSAIPTSTTIDTLQSAKFQTVNAKDHAPVKGMSISSPVSIKNQVGRPRKLSPDCKDLVATAGCHAKQLPRSLCKGADVKKNISAEVQHQDASVNKVPNECIVTHVSPPKSSKREKNSINNVHTAVVLPRKVNQPSDLSPSSCNYKNESIYFPLLEDARSITSLSQTLDLDAHCPWEDVPAEETIVIKTEPNDYIVVDDSDEDDVHSSASGGRDNVTQNSNLSQPTSIPMTPEVMEQVDSMLQNKALFDKLPHVDVIDGSGNKITTEDILKLDGPCADADTDESALHLRLKESGDEQSQSSEDFKDFDDDEELSYGEETLKRSASISGNDQVVKKSKTSEQFEGEPANCNTYIENHSAASMFRSHHVSSVGCNENTAIGKVGASSISHLSRW